MKQNKKKFFYISIFLFFLFILFLSPISGDDWGNYEVGKTGLYHSIGNAVGMYFDWEGRFVSRILINVLTYHKYLWNIVNSILITLTIYFGVQIVKPKKKKLVYLLSFLLVLFMNVYTFSQTITWIAGNITYFFVIPILLGHFYYLTEERKQDKKIRILLLGINILAPMFVEHMALTLIAGNIMVLLFRYQKNKKWDKEIIFYLILSLISTLSMLLSPGSRARSLVENLEFNQLNIFEKVIYNIPNFIFYTFIANSYFLVLSMTSNFLLIKKYGKNKMIKILLLLFLLPVALITILIYPISSFYPNKFSFFINPNHILLILYWLSYLVISFGLFLMDSIKRKEWKTSFFFLLGISANTFMLLSPTWGYRTSLFTYMALSISCICIIDCYFKVKKLFIYFLYGVVGITMLGYFTLYMNVSRCQNELEKSIKKQLDEGSKIMEIEKFPYFINCNINPENDYHIKQFKKYYKIPDNVEIKLTEKHWKYLIIYSKEVK